MNSFPLKLLILRFLVKVAKLATLIIQVMQKSPVGKFKLWGSSDNISKYHKPALEALGDPKP